MKKIVSSSEIARSVVAVVVSIITICLVFVSLIYLDFRHSLKKEIDRIEEVRQENNNYIRIVKLKTKLSSVVKKVTYTSFITMTNILQDRNGNIDFNANKNAQRIKVWEKEVQPVLNAVDIHMDDGYTDEIRSMFNKINDKVIEVFLLQKDLIADAKANLPPNLAKLNQLKRNTHNLAEGYNKFLDDSREQYLEYYQRTNFFRHDTVLLISLFLVTLTIIIAIVFYLIRYLQNNIKVIHEFLKSLRKGELPQKLILDGYDYLPIKKSLNYLLNQMEKILKYSESVTKGDFSIQRSVELEQDSNFSITFSKMQESLVEVSERERQRDHVNNGLATFSDVLSSTTSDVNLFAEEVIRNLVKFLNANQAALFLVKEEGDEQFLEMTYCYAYNKQKFLEKRVKLGEGLIGQAWIEKERVYMTEVPDMYTDITSGLGESTPRCILVVPLEFNGVVQGIIELASFQPLKDYELSFVDEVVGSISSSLASVVIHSRTNEYLRQSEKLTDLMKEQEEVTKSKIGELAIIQEEAKQREEKYIREVRRLRKRLSAYESHT